MAWAPSIPFSVKFWYHYWYKKYTTMEFFPAILVYFLYQKWYLYVIGKEFEGA
jgi:hypothetical protein